MRSLGVILLVGAACSGVPSSPEQRAAEEPATVELTAVERSRVTVLATAALAHATALDWAAAQTAAVAALALDPRCARARAVRAHCLADRARRVSPPSLDLWQEAEGELLLAVRLAPDDPEVAWLQARFLELDGHLSAAAKVAEHALERSPTHLGCLEIAAGLRYELAEEVAALRLLKRWRVLEPGRAEVLYRLAWCQLRLAKSGRAELGVNTGDGSPAGRAAAFAPAAASFAEYRRLVPDDAAGFEGEACARLEAWRATGDDASDAGLEVARQLYAAACQLDVTSPQPEFEQGVVLELQGKPGAARGAYERALRRDPEHLPSLLNMAASLATEDRAAAAARYCRRALGLRPSSGERRRIEAFLAQTLASGDADS